MGNLIGWAITLAILVLLWAVVGPAIRWRQKRQRRVRLAAFQAQRNPDREGDLVDRLREEARATDRLREEIERN